MWPCHRVHITVCMALLVYVTLSATECIHALNHPYTSGRFLLEIFYEYIQSSLHLLDLLSFLFTSCTVLMVQSRNFTKAVVVLICSHSQVNFSIIAWAVEHLNENCIRYGSRFVRDRWKTLTVKYQTKHKNDPLEISSQSMAVLTMLFLVLRHQGDWRRRKETEKKLEEDISEF